jgi:hypothetical protein
MAAVSLAGPIVAARPALERPGEVGGGGGMSPIYKRINHFPIGQDRRTPGHEELAQLHERS